MLNDERNGNPPINDAYLAYLFFRESVSADNEANVFQRVIEFLQEAFSSELSTEDEIKGRAILGNANIYRAISLGEHMVVFDHGLRSSELVLEGIESIEVSLKKDAESGLGFFKNFSHRYELLGETIGEIWSIQASYLQRSLGNRSAITYLNEKIQLIQYLGISYFPCVSRYLGVYLSEEGYPDEALQWLRYAIRAECFDDDDRSLECIETAKQNIEELQGN